MRSKISKGGVFYTLAKYMLDVGAKATGDKDSLIVSTNMTGRDHNELSREFNSVARMRSDIKKMVWHASLSLPKGETLEQAKWNEVVRAYLSKMGIDAENHQFLAVVHNDTEHQHVHIAVNRVGLNKKIYLAKKDVKRSIKACVDLEKELKLKITYAPDEVDDYGNVLKRKAKKTPTDKELNMNDDVSRIKLQEIIEASIPNVGTTDVKSFCTTLIKSGVTPIPNVTKAGKLNGFAFSIDGMKFKGSSLGDDYNWKSLQEKVTTSPEQYGEYLLDLKRKATSALDSQDDLTKDVITVDKKSYKGEKFQGGYKNQAQRAMWAVYGANVSADIAHKIIIRKAQNGDKQITADGGKHRFLDKGDVILLRSTIDMEDAIKAMIQVGEAKGWKLENLNPSGADDFKKKFKEVQAQMIEERKQKTLENEQIKATEESGIRAERSLQSGIEGEKHNSSKVKSDSGYSESDAGARPVTTSDSKDHEGVGEPRDGINGSTPSNSGGSKPDGGDDSGATEIRTINTKRVGSHLPASAENKATSEETRAVQASNRALSSLNDRGSSVADRLTDEVSSSSLRSTPNSKKPEYRNGRDTDVKVKAWRQQHNLLRAEKYRIQLIDRNDAGDKKPWNLGKQKDGSEKFFTAEEVEQKINFLRAKNAMGKDIYIAPISDNHHFLVIDDMTPKTQQQMLEDGYKPTLLQQSSKGNVQAILRIDRDNELEHKQEQSLANTLVKDINTKYGDKRFSGVVHPFRMAGFSNKKAGRNNAFTVILDGSTGANCSKSHADFVDSVKAKKAEIENKKVESQQSKVVKKRSEQKQETYTLNDPETEPEHWKQFRAYRNKHEGLAKHMNWEIDESTLDFKASIDCLKNHMPEEFVKQAIVFCSPEMDTRHNDADSYAWRTVTKAGEKANVEIANKFVSKKEAEKAKAEAEAEAKPEPKPEPKRKPKRDKNGTIVGWIEE